MDEKETEGVSAFWRGIRGEMNRRQGEPVEVRGEGVSIPLTYQQERLWFAERLSPGKAAQNIPQHLRLVGKLDRDALYRALREIVARHEVLRTSIDTSVRSGRQLIATSIPVEVPLRDLGGLPEKEKAAKLVGLVAEITEMPISVQDAPLWRFGLVRLSEEEHVLLRVFHHVIFDHWSGDMFLRELAVLYECYLRGEASTLKTLPVQYGDYALWQRKQMSSEWLREGLVFWERFFEGADEPLRLPVDGQGLEDDGKGGLKSASLGEELTKGLATLSERAGVSLFVVLMSGFMAWLHGRTGQRDLMICTPVSGRSRRELRPLIGYFNNIVPMRVEVSGRLTVSELLERVSRMALELQAYQDVPFQKIAEIPAERGLTLRRCLFGFQNTPSRPLVMGDVSMRRFRAGERSTDFDLSLSIWREGEAWSVTVRYRASLFEEETIERMLREYQDCLESFTKGPQLRIEELAERGGRRRSILGRLLGCLRRGR